VWIPPRVHRFIKFHLTAKSGTCKALVPGTSSRDPLSFSGAWPFSGKKSLRAKMGIALRDELELEVEPLIVHAGRVLMTHNRLRSD
jgi:hypothetical protein